MVNMTQKPIKEFSKNERDVFDLALKKDYLVHPGIKSLNQSLMPAQEDITNLVIT